MKFALICSISLFALLGLIEAAGYGYQQSFYHVPVPVLVPPPRGGGGTNGGFCKYHSVTVKPFLFELRLFEVPS